MGIGVEAGGSMDSHTWRDASSWVIDRSSKGELPGHTGCSFRRGGQVTGAIRHAGNSLPAPLAAQRKLPTDYVPQGAGDHCFGG